MNAASTAPMHDVGEEVAAELTELAVLLERLDDAAWRTQSLCPLWTVREVVAHMTMPVRWSLPGIIVQMARARFNWDAAADRIARRDAALPIADLTGALRSDRLHRWRPPGGGAEGALVHAVVHGLDITIPLGIDRPVAAGRIRTVLDGLVRPASLKHFGVDINGLALRADDLDWSFGSGRAVVSDGRTLMLFLSGRQPRPNA